MDKRQRIADRFAAWRRLFQRTRLECRECQVFCERVISPQDCLDSGCSAVYVYEDGDAKMFGCVHKVFAPELDLAAFSGKGERRRSPQGYGTLKLNRSPRRQCKVTVEQAYPAAFAAPACSNPTFFHQVHGETEGRMRLSTKVPQAPQTPQPQD